MVKSWRFVAVGAVAALLAMATGGCQADATSRSASRETGAPSPRPVAVSSPSPDVLQPPVVDESNAILATNSGSGSMSRPQRFSTHGSYMFHATCARGSRIAVETSDRSRTPIPCSGLTSRMRFIANQPAHESYRVIARSGTEWAITWTDYEPER
jgi:hypothetical protein